MSKDRQLQDVLFQVDAQKEENRAMSGVQSNLESTRGHLQKQLRQKEGDCNRMAVQIRVCILCSLQGDLLLDEIV